MAAELAAFRQFYELLKTEADALGRTDIDQLGRLAQLKSDQVLALSQLTEKRNHLLSALSYPPNRQGMEQWLQNCGPGKNLVEKDWKALLDLAQAGRLLNEENGALIDAKLRHNTQALAVLQAAANQASLYGPDGKPQPASGGRPIGKV